MLGPGEKLFSKKEPARFDTQNQNSQDSAYSDFTMRFVNFYGIHVIILRILKFSELWNQTKLWRNKLELFFRFDRDMIFIIGKMIQGYRVWNPKLYIFISNLRKIIKDETFFGLMPCLRTCSRTMKKCWRGMWSESSCRPNFILLSITWIRH